MKRVGILTAMQEEGALLITHYGLKKINNLDNISFYGNNSLVLAISGVGKIQASIATTLLIQKYEPDYLINIGISGNLKGKDAKIGDIFLINSVAQHDIYLPFDGAHLGYAKDPIYLPLSMDSIKGNKQFGVFHGAFCLTGDQFIDEEERVKALYQQTQADVVEMESFAFASTARELGKINNTLIIKAISDGANNAAKLAHMDNLSFAMQNSLVVLDQIIQELN